MDENDRKALVADLMPLIMERLSQTKPWKNNIFIPSIDVYSTKNSDPFMNYSTCSSSDFFHPEFRRISSLIGIPVSFHRKYWEWVFITHHAYRMGCVARNKSGLVFGVGRESLPAVFAKDGMRVIATDAPSEIGKKSGWASDQMQFADGLASLPRLGLDNAEFERLVSWKECDMNNIDDELKDFDICWSSCCLEHLGTIKAGVDFIVNSVEKTLKLGGIAIHTTELNLSSNELTIESGPTVLFRRKDIESVVEILTERGHFVEEIVIAPDSHLVDGYVDTPPYSQPPHLKLQLEGYTATSIGFVIRRGR